MGLIKRFVGKVSDDNAKDGIIDLLSKMMGVNPSEIKLPDEMLNQIDLMQDQKIEIKKIINPFYDSLKLQNTKESNKKINELIDLGKFIYYFELGNEIKIIECGERPDFIIKYKDELIGVEHTGIYDNHVVAEIKTLKKIIKKCQDKLNKEQSEITGLFNIIIIPSKIKDYLPFKENEIIQTICNYIIAKKQNQESEKPDFVSDLIQSQHPILELTLGEDYWLAELTATAIAATISKKENKIDTYKTSKNLNKCWLLIVIDGASSVSSFNIDLGAFPMHLTPFDKIYIFDNFKGLIIKGEKNEGVV